MRISQYSQCILLSLLPSPQKISFNHKSSNQIEHIAINGNLTTNSCEAVVAAACQGLGVAVLSRSEIYRELHQGKLTPIFEDYKIEDVGIYAVYPHRKHLPAKVRVFMEFLEKRCANASWAS